MIYAGKTEASAEREQVMEILQKKFYIVMVQVDHLSGEQLGQVIDRFYEAGASNVQIMPTVTKKNRPSHLVLIDCREDLIGRIEEMIVGELQTGGWHRIPTEHRFLRNELLERTIRLKKDGSFRDHAVQIKHFIGGDSRPEYESVQALRKCIREEYGQEISYGTLYNYACAAAVQEEPVVLDLDG